MNDPAIIDEMLRNAKTIAVVGMSDKTLARQPQHRPLSGRARLSRASRSIPRSRRFSACHAIPISTRRRPRPANKDDRRESILSMCFAPQSMCRRSWTT